MQIIENQRARRSSQIITAEHIGADGRQDRKELSVMTEELIAVRMEDRIAGHIPCTPDHLPELVLGWLYTEGKIPGLANLRTLRIEESQTATRQLEATLILGEGDRNTDPSGQQGLEARRTQQERFLRKSQDEQWRWLHELKARFDRERPLREQTGATHSCMLVHIADETCPQVLYQSEDAGRHSAMDKAIGWGLLHDIRFLECLLFTSGRISASMAGKAAASGVIALATAKPLVSSGAIRIAHQQNVLLVGKNDENEIYWFPMR